MEIVTEPTVRRLVTVEAARAHISGIDPADAAASAQLTALIDRASAMVARELGYRPWRTRYRVTRTMRFSSRIWVVGAPIDVHFYSITPAVKMLTTLYGVVRFEEWLQVGETYVLDYESGWPVGSAAVNIPSDLAGAVLDAVAQDWFARGRSPDLSSQDLDGIGGLNWEPRRLPLHVREVIDGYRAIGV